MEPGHEQLTTEVDESALGCSDSLELISLGAWTSQSLYVVTLKLSESESQCLGSVHLPSNCVYCYLRCCRLSESSALGCRLQGKHVFYSSSIYMLDSKSCFTLNDMSSLRIHN